MLRDYLDEKRLNFLDVHCGTPLRGILCRKIENQSILSAVLVLLNRTFRLVKMISLQSPTIIVTNELKLIDQAIVALRNSLLGNTNRESMI